MNADLMIRIVQIVALLVGSCVLLFRWLRKRNAPRRSSGFTLIELLIVIAIIGILAAIAIPNIMNAGKHPKGIRDNKTAIEEQAQTEQNQQTLFAKQPPPRIDWSLERDNLTKRFKLQNDRAVMFFMYVFIEGVGDPVGYYEVNKVSSVDSQLTNPMQIVPVTQLSNVQNHTQVLPSPAEDGSYGTNGAGVFGFTPEDIYIETNMHYIVSTIPLKFAHPVQRLAIVNTDEAQKLLDVSKKAMGSK